jgi:hypothetical protein
MLKLSKSLRQQPVMSLRTGTPIATALEPVINPHNLKIIGGWCKSRGSSKQEILLAEDVREIMPSGLAVNDEEALSQPEDLIRHREILDIRFQLIDKLVKTRRKKLGKVSDYSYDDKGLFVQKLYVARSLIKVFTTEDTLIIDRTQIIEVSDHYILVRDTDLKLGQEEMAPAAAAMPSA